MSGRLGVVRRVREHMERRRIIELMLAEREAAEARADREAARAERDARLKAGTEEALTPDQLTLLRTHGLAVQEVVFIAERRVESADEVTERSRLAAVDAAIARRSVERVAEKRADEAARDASRRAERHLDDVAVERWRRS